MKKSYLKMPVKPQWFLHEASWFLLPFTKSKEYSKRTYMKFFQIT